jgi:hypothetical protein
MGVRVSNQRTLAWWLVDRILRLLDAEEREAVRGDLAESCDSAAQALRSVFHLIMHRQSMLWQYPRPWLVLFLFVMPLGMLLSFASRSHAGPSSIYLWLVVNNANLSLLHNAGYWYTLLQIVPALLRSHPTRPMLSICHPTSSIGSEIGRTPSAQISLRRELPRSG